MFVARFPLKLLVSHLKLQLLIVSNTCSFPSLFGEDESKAFF